MHAPHGDLYATDDDNNKRNSGGNMVVISHYIIVQFGTTYVLSVAPILVM